MSPTHPTPPVDPRRLNGDGATAWTNLGWWPGATDYPSAAAGLARRVGAAAALGPDDVVVDYACGFGDSLKLWIDAFGVRRVVGVEPDPAIVTQVRARIAAWGLAERVHVIAARAESLAPAAADADASAVVCVDAAYHFAPRRAWLAQVAASLPRGGRLAFSDLVVTGGNRAPLLRAAARLMRIPRQNLVTPDGLAAELTAEGLALTTSERAGTAVLDGFAAQRNRAGLAVALTRLGLRWLRRGGTDAPAVDYLIVGAVRR